jgi:hypothetical protein
MTDFFVKWHQENHVECRHFSDLADAEKHYASLGMRWAKKLLSCSDGLTLLRDSFGEEKWLSFIPECANGRMQFVSQKRSVNVVCSALSFTPLQRFFRGEVACDRSCGVSLFSRWY